MVAGQEAKIMVGQSISQVRKLVGMQTVSRVAALKRVMF